VRRLQNEEDHSYLRVVAVGGIGGGLHKKKIAKGRKREVSGLVGSCGIVAARRGVRCES
jgi:hypothetical protein